MGYSRYLLTFVAVYWLYLISELNMKYSFSLKRFWWLGLVFGGLCLSSVSTDFGWRPSLLLLRSSINRPYLVKSYIDGLRLLGKDRLVDVENSYRSIIGNKETLIIAYRGQESFLAYLASDMGSSVVQAVDITKYHELINSNRISENYMRLLKNIDDENKILVIGNKQWLDLKLIYWTKNRNCSKIDLDPSAWYFQSPTFYTETSLYLCVRY